MMQVATTGMRENGINNMEWFEKKIRHRYISQH